MKRLLAFKTYLPIVAFKLTHISRETTLIIVNVQATIIRIFIRLGGLMISCNRSQYFKDVTQFYKENFFFTHGDILMYKRFISRMILAFLMLALLSVSSIILCAHLINHSSLQHNAHVIFDQAKLPLTIVRILFYICFYLAWPKIIARRARRQHWPKENISKAFEFRYPIVLFFLFLETLNQISQSF